MRIMPGGALEQDQDISGPSSVFVGRKLDDHRGAFLLEYPMDKGHVVDGGWDSMERVWEVWLSMEVIQLCRIMGVHLLTAPCRPFPPCMYCAACLLESQSQC